jgi:hypothetical protein
LSPEIWEVPAEVLTIDRGGSAGAPDAPPEPALASSPPPPSSPPVAVFPEVPPDV